MMKTSFVDLANQTRISGVPAGELFLWLGSPEVFLRTVTEPSGYNAVSLHSGRLMKFDGVEYCALLEHEPVEIRRKRENKE